MKRRKLRAARIMLAVILMMALIIPSTFAWADEVDSNGGDPTGDDPTGDDPTGDDPTGDDPTGDDPTGDDPTGDDPTGDDPTGDDPTGDDPTGDDPTGDDPTGDDPTGDDPTGGDPNGSGSGIGFSPFGAGIMGGQPEPESEPDMKIEITSAPVTAKVGDTITIGYTITSQWSHIINQISIEDVFGNSFPTPGDLAAEASYSNSYDITITEDDIKDYDGTYTLYVEAQAVVQGGKNQDIGDEDSVNIDIQSNPVVTSTITVVKTINKENGKAHDDVTFQLYSGEWKSGLFGGYWKWTLVAQDKTDADGIIEFGEQEPGRYKLFEFVPTGYTSSLGLWPEEEFDLDVGEEKVINVINYISTITVIKTIDSEDGDPHEGVTFELYCKVLGKWVPRDSKTTGADGIIEFGWHTPGLTYKIKEIVPEGYTSSLKGDESEFVLGLHGKEINVINYADAPIPADITVFKTMDDGTSPEGIEFTLYKAVGESWEAIKTLTTDGEGVVVFTELEAGTYKVEEELDGYYADYGGTGNEVYLAGQDEEIHVVNRILPGIRVVKTLDERGGDPHVGVEFKLYRHYAELQISTLGEEDGWPRTGTTDVNGEILFGGLECEGYYYTLEEIGMDDYEVKYLDQDFEEYDECPEIVIDCEGITTVFVVNTKIDDEYGTITVIKTIDEEDGDPQEGVTFTLYRVYGENEEEEWAEGVTDSEGIIEFVELLPGTYRLVETVPVGFTSSLENNEIVFELESGEDKEIPVINYTDEESGGGGGTPRRPRGSSSTGEPVEVLEEPQVFTPLIEEEPVEEPVEVPEEPPVMAGDNRELPFTGGNPALFMYMGTVLAGLGVFLRRRTY